MAVLVDSRPKPRRYAPAKRSLVRIMSKAKSNHNRTGEVKDFSGIGMKIDFEKMRNALHPLMSLLECPQIK